MKSFAKKLWLPVLIFLFFLGMALFRKDLLSIDALEVLSRSPYVWTYLLPTAIWLSGAYLFNRFFSALFWDRRVARAIEGSVPRLLKDVSAFVIYLIALMGIIGLVFDRSLTALWATSGAIGIVLGFALQNLIADVFSGLAVNFDRPYKIGDWVMVHGRTPEERESVVGRVSEINWRTTRLLTTDNNTVVMPNSIIATKIITNFMEPGERSRFELIFRLDFDVPTERALRVLTAGVMATVGEKHGPLATPGPKVKINGIDKFSGVEYAVRYWIVPRQVSPRKARHAVTAAILAHLQHAGLSLAYPKQDLYYEKMPPRKLDSRSMDDRVELLGRVELFAHLESRGLTLLAEQMRQRTFAAGATLIAKGEAGNSMFILVEGLLAVVAEGTGPHDAVGVGKIGPGEFFGEMSLLTGAPRSATIKAVTEAMVYEITKQDVEILFNRHPEVADRLGRVVAERQMRNEQAVRPGATGADDPDRAAHLTLTIMDRMKAFFKNG